MLYIMRNKCAQLISFGRRHAGLLVLLTIYLAVTLAYGFLNPLGEGPDEVANIELISFISQKGHLPRTYAERQAAGYKSDWPMLLYHAPVGMATRWIDYDVLPQLKELDNHDPRRLLVEDDFAHFALIHTDDEAFPYQGIVLLWHLARVVATLFSAAALVVIYVTVLAIRPGDRSLALGAAAVAVAVPEFNFLASVAHEDNILALFAALFTLTLVRAWQRPQSRWTYAWLGLWFGLALTTKYSIGLMPILVVVVLIAAVRHKQLDWRAAGRRLVFFTAVVTGVAMWWLVYVEWYFNQVKELGLVAGLLKPLMASGIDVSMRRVASFITGGAITAPAATLDPGPAARVTLWGWLMTLLRPFWFIKWPADEPVLVALSLSFLAVCCLAAAGLWRAWRRHEDWPWSTLGLLGLQIGLLLPFPLLRLYLTRDVIIAAQARHILIPGATAIGLLLTLGVSAWLPSAYRRFAGPGLAGVFLTVSLVSFFGYVLPLFPARLPVRTSTNAAQDIPNPMHMSLEDGIELVGYQIGEANEYGALPITLFWHGSAYVDQDYLVELSLVDQEGAPHSMWLGQPVNGHYPTRAWEPGDLVRDTIWLPLTSMKAGEYDLQLHLRSYLDWPASSPTDEAQSVLLTSYSLPSPVNSRLSSARPVIAWDDGRPVANMPTYHYRATIPVTQLRPGPDGAVSLVGPDGVARVPQAKAGNTWILLVGADWPSGRYDLRTRGNDGTTESDPLLRVQVRPRNFQVPPMSNAAYANFGDEVMLLGYDFPEHRVQPGETLPITLYWQALRPTGRNYVVSNHLLNQSDLRQWGGADRIPHYYYSTILWARGEVVRDDFLVPVDPAAPPGVYFLDVGLYAQLVGQSWHLPLIRDGETLDANSVTVAPIKVGGPPPEVTIKEVSPQHARADNLANLVTLLGYDLGMDAEALNLTLYWRCDATLPADYTTFVHVRDATGQATGEQGTIVAQMDRPPANGAYPTSLWDVGEIIRDAVQIPIPPQVSAGEYEIIVGLYDPETNGRLPALDARGESIGDAIRLEQEISVPVK
jgi:4-amino-4-deoxy-L-arabinose transferase-like glycosyltransferase